MLKTCFLLLLSTFSITIFAQPGILQEKDFKHYIDSFKENDEELYKQAYPNSEAWKFIADNVPLFECPDKQLEQTYYFRWWTYRKHIRKTDDGYVITEFLPDVSWAGKHNTISCPAAHHFYEGRWLRNAAYLQDYARFWFKGGGSPRSYSFWPADAISRFCDVKGNYNTGLELLPDLIANYQTWKTSNFDSTGLFWQVDDRDGMEVSVSGAMGKRGEGYRATINSYMYGEARAIAELAARNQDQKQAAFFQKEALELRKRLLNDLWDKKAGFFKVIPRGNNDRIRSDARELHGFTPWYFNIPEAKHAVAWRQLMDNEGFRAPYGLTSVEQRHPGFKVSYEGHECQWNGPSWPFATSITLTGLANLLNGEKQNVVSQADFFDSFLTFSRAHQRVNEQGKTVSWIDENLNPYTGDWISRTRLKNWDANGWNKGKGGVERGKDYNHSTFCDLLITGIIGVRPSASDTLVINPLIPDNAWDYFCLDGLQYHNKVITVLFDKSGKKYGRGEGFRVFVDQVEKFSSPNLCRASLVL